MALRDLLASGRGLTRIAAALERIAAAQEEQVRLSRLARGGGAGFQTGYESPESVTGSVLLQTDEEFARWEQIADREARGEAVDPSEEPSRE